LDDIASARAFQHTLYLWVANAQNSEIEVNLSSSPDIPEKEIRERCATILSQAAEEARRLGHGFVGTEHLFIAISKNKEGPTANLLKRAGLNPVTVRNEIRMEIGSGEGATQDVLPLTPRSEIVLSLAIFLAEQEEFEEIGEAHLLLALLQEGEGVAVRKLIEMDFDVNLWLQRLLLEAQEQEDLGGASDSMFNSDNLFDFDSDEFNFDDSSVEDGRPVPTPLLDKYGRDLVAAASNGRIGPAVARDSEIRAVARTLARSKKNNPLLLGDAGVGKTAVVEGLAYAIHTGKAPRSLLAKRIVEIEIGTLVAGTSLRGQFEERLLGIVNEVNRTGNVVLFIDEIHTIVGAGDTIDSNLDAANILKPALARGDIMCIGATTHEEYRKAIAADPALERRFRTIDIEEPSQDATMLILEGQRMRLETHHGVTIPEETMKSAIELSMRYLPDRRLPDKALDLLDEACTRVVIRTNVTDDMPENGLEDLDIDLGGVRPSDITSVLSEWTGIPVNDMTREDKERLANLDRLLKETVIGQDSAVETVADTIKTARAGLGNPDRPVGVFLFLGPSGVGKTELALSLAENLFGTQDALMRLDMSEFHDAHTVSRLIGAPPGYRDSKRGGQLTDGLRRRPYSVVLLDEVEKAAPEVFDLFLQVFDEGRLSDANGRPVDARHAVFIMTSNIGTQETSKSMGFGGRVITKQDFSSYLGQFFRPEFINRLDEIITFNALDENTLSQILDLQMGAVHERLNEQGVLLHLEDDARELLLRLGHDPANGARPLRRTIERLVTRPLSDKLLRSEFNVGDRVVARADVDGTLRFEVEPSI
jgi:ATP-dependent Clp protease ATP-binding subunit ClpC